MTETPVVFLRRLLAFSLVLLVMQTWFFDKLLEID